MRGGMFCREGAKRGVKSTIGNYGATDFLVGTANPTQPAVIAAEALRLSQGFGRRGQTRRFLAPLILPKTPFVQPPVSP